jgi:hypothetical protein
MSWTTITVATLKSRNAGAEVTALSESALADDQPDPVPEIIAMVVNEVRGYISAAGITLQAGETVPGRLVLAAINRIRYEAATRLPGGAMLDDDRRESNRAAVSLLESVAAKRFAVEEASTADSESTARSDGGISVVAKPTRTQTAADFQGL